jgi:hypothetical protein
VALSTHTQKFFRLFLLLWFVDFLKEERWIIVSTHFCLKILVMTTRANEDWREESGRDGSPAGKVVIEGVPVESVAWDAQCPWCEAQVEVRGPDEEVVVCEECEKLSTVDHENRELTGHDEFECPHCYQTMTVVVEVGVDSATCGQCEGVVRYK